MHINENIAPTDGIILAAGLSTRAGRFKMELPLGERTVIQRAVEGMAPFVERIIVVAGWRAERVEELLASYPQVQIVVNAGYRAGMFSSVRAGLGHVRAARFFLLPGDHPLVGAEVYRRLLATPGEIIIPIYNSRKGHPVLLAGGLIPEILAQPAESTLRDYIAAKGYTPVAVDDEGVLLDVDTPEDYERVASRQRHT